MASTLNVPPSIIALSAAVCPASKVIHSRVAILYQVGGMIFYMISFLLLLLYIMFMTLSSCLVLDIPTDPCNPSPCGANSVCNVRNGVGSCTCVKGYFGDPYTGCRPECVTSNDCPSNKACLGMKCRDPCPGSCGINAECRVFNHNPQCYCISGYTGNALTICRAIEPSKI